MARTKRVQAICERAAEVIEERGWTRGKFQRDGRVCLMGAVNVALGSPSGRPTPSTEPLFFEVVDRLKLEIGGGEWENVSPSEWNDSQGSRRPVLRLLRTGVPA